MYDAELDRFKRDIHLVQYALERFGYARDPRESSRHSHVLRHAGTDDKIVVRHSDGHWTYFSVRDGRDNGTIVDFLQRRGVRSLGEVRQQLRDWLGVARPPFEPERIRPAALEAARSATPAQAFAAARSAENNPYLFARGIRTETLREPRFAGTWRIDARGNTLFPHRDDAGDLTGYEIKNRGFTGFAPGGTKTSWRSNASPSDRALVVTESAIDAMSHFQLHRDRAASARYVSIGGEPSPRQLEHLDRLIAMLPKGALVVAAVDADIAGTKLAHQLEGLAAKHLHVRFREHRPDLAVGKDWNAVLQRTERSYIRSLPPAVRALNPALGLSR
jgi:hypothetical protein